MKFNPDEAEYHAKDILVNNYREVSLGGSTFNITLKSSYSNENIEYLLGKAFGILLSYEDPSLREEMKRDMKNMLKPGKI